MATTPATPAQPEYVWHQGAHPACCHAARTAQAGKIPLLQVAPVVHTHGTHATRQGCPLPHTNGTRGHPHVHGRADWPATGQSAGHVPHVQPSQAPPQWWQCGTESQGLQPPCQDGTHSQACTAPRTAPNALGGMINVATNANIQRESDP